MRSIIAAVLILTTFTALFADDALLAKRDELHHKLNAVKWHRKVLVLPFADKTEGKKADVAAVRASIEETFRTNDYEPVVATDAAALDSGDEAAMAQLAEKYGAGTVVAGVITDFHASRRFNPATLVLPGGGATAKAKVGFEAWVYRYDQGTIVHSAQSHRTSVHHSYGAYQSLAKRTRDASTEAADVVFGPYFAKYPGLSLLTPNTPATN